MAERIEKLGQSVILYDDTLSDHIEESLFDFARWRDAPTAPGYSGGRGKTLFIEHGGRPCVLRHYHRGGFIGRFLNDQFLFTGESQSRPFLEWRLLDRLCGSHLPVPRPVAARLRRRGLIYSADLITLRIPDVVPLSTRLRERPMAEPVWRRIGETLARFHRVGVYHADLTAHNLQIDHEDNIFLLDFDRGRIMTGRGDWAARNLHRLHRSLRKVSATDGVEFSATGWSQLKEAYDAGVAC